MNFVGLRQELPFHTDLRPVPFHFVTGFIKIWLREDGLARVQKGDFHPGHDERFSLTVAFHPLVDEAVQQRSAVVAEGGTAVAVDLELVLASGILQKSGKERNHLQLD